MNLLEHNLFMDVNARFCINVPLEESSPMRWMYHIECIFFFLVDNWPQIQKQFQFPQSAPWTLRIFIDKYKEWLTKSCLEIPISTFERWWHAYIEVYKKNIPVAGAFIFQVLPNGTYQFLAVQGKESHKWGLPKGKRNACESWLNCAMREVWEETGWNGWSLATSWLQQETKQEIQLQEITPADFKQQQETKKSFNLQLQPRRPASLLSTSETQISQPKINSVTLPSSSSKNIIFHFVNLHKHKQMHQTTPTRIYILDYNRIMAYLLSEQNSSKIHHLSTQFSGDKYEISQIQWLQWPPKKKLFNLTFQLKFYSSVLSEAMHLVSNSSSSFS